MMALPLTRAAARRTGTHFLTGAPADHECRATCYRAGRNIIYTLCDYGHMVSAREPDRAFGGSGFAASLNDLPIGAPFVIAGPSQPELPLEWPSA